MKGWKTPRIIHMFTQLLKRPGGGPHKHKIDKDQQKRHDLNSGRSQLDEVGRGILCLWGDREEASSSETWRIIVRRQGYRNVEGNPHRTKADGRALW